MIPTTPRRRSGVPGIFFFALIFLTFMQLLSDLIETTYAFGLLGVSIPPEIVSVLLLLLPLLAVLLPGALERRGFAVVTGLLAILCRGLSLMLDTRGRMLSAGLGAGLMLLFFAALVWQVRGRPHEVRSAMGLRAGIGLAFAALLWMLLRAGNHGSDLSNFTAQFNTGYFLVLAAALYLYQWVRDAAAVDDAAAGSAAAESAASPASDDRPFGWLAAAGLGIGLVSAPLLLYFGLSSPAVIARWTDASYPAIAWVLAGAAALWVGLWSLYPRLRARLTTPRALEVWNGLFIVALALLLRAHSVDFPADPAAYPLPAPAPGPLAVVTLAMALLLHPVLYVDFALFFQALVDGAARARPRVVAAAFSAGALWLLVMSFAHVFTTVYDYIPVIGPLFRDNFWIVYTAAALGMLLPLFLLRRAGPPEEPVRSGFIAFTVLVLFAAVGFTVLTRNPGPVPPPAETGTLRVLTFNIQQGYTAGGARGLDEQLALMDRLAPDIIGLQESDTARISGGNTDAVRYFAERLNMHAYYGPSTVTGTFGVALLSRYPIQDARTFFMYSEGEQTAAIQARVRAGGKDFTVLVTHLGNRGPLVQQQQVLQALDGAQNVIAMGDFNFRPGTQQYALTLAQFEDSWATAAEREMIPPDQEPENKVDHVFVSPGTRVERAVYLGPGPSDHPAMYVEISLDDAVTTSIESPTQAPQEDAMFEHYFFDDFAYTEKDAMRANGWILRDAPGWPGVPGAVWSADHIALVDDPQRPGGRLVQMTSATEGVEEGSRQTQLCHCRKYFEGTYASRVRFLDEPVSGPGGDQVVTTFYQISPSRYPMDPDYSEMDFEYLPNGGWGHSGPTMFVTSWETFQLEPWIAKNQSTPTAKSFAGWHTLVLQVMDGTVRYYADGVLLGEHTGSVYPRIPVAMSYNLWFIRGGLAPSKEPREYRQWIDWTFYADKTLLSPEQVEQAVADLRAAGTAFNDTVDPGDPALESPCNF